MPLTKHSHSSSHRSSSSGFHPFGGRLSKRFGDTLSPEDPYLSYHDICLTREDVDSIRDDWLTDNAIAFWEEYLEHEELPKYPKANIVLLRPSMTFMLANSRDPVGLKSALPDLTRITHIFLPVNDCHNVEMAEGGAHWSLLVVSLIDRAAFHYDSLGGSNRNDAQLVCRQLEKLLGCGLRFLHLHDAPQQDNGSDCGVYVCLLMKHLLLNKLLQAHAETRISMAMSNKGVDARGGRRRMLEMIEERRREGERRRSRSHSPGSSKSRSPPRVGDENDPRKLEAKKHSSEDPRR